VANATPVFSHWKEPPVSILQNAVAALDECGEQNVFFPDRSSNPEERVLLSPPAFEPQTLQRVAILTAI
jgi:hypothetical protein